MKFVEQTEKLDGTELKYKGTVKILILLHYVMYQSLMRHTRKNFTKIADIKMAGLDITLLLSTVTVYLYPRSTNDNCINIMLCLEQAKCDLGAS